MSSQSDLNEFMERMRSKPLLTTALCSKPYTHDHDRHTEDSSNSDHLTHTQEYIATVNMHHPQIQQMFKEAFDKARQLLEQGDKFRVTVSLYRFIYILLFPNTNFFLRFNMH